jgi:hypothetical protein
VAGGAGSEFGGSRQVLGVSMTHPNKPMHPTADTRHVIISMGSGRRVIGSVSWLQVRVTMTSRQRKKDRSGYGSSWQESPFEKLDLPFTIKSLKNVLAHGADEDSPFTHQQIADWCFRFWWEREEGSLSGILDGDLEIAAEVALDVESQWGMYLLEEFTLGELQAMDFSKVRLPVDWFRGWQHALTERAS